MKKLVTSSSCRNNELRVTQVETTSYELGFEIPPGLRFGPKFDENTRNSNFESRLRCSCPYLYNKDTMEWRFSIGALHIEAGSLQEINPERS